MGNRNLAVGLFVIAALTIGGILTVWFTGQRGSDPLEHYHVSIESDVSGLTLGGPVYFLGVQVGDVADLAIVPGNPARVLVEIRVRPDTPIDSGTWATLAAQGITGVSVINLYSEPGQNGPLDPPADAPLPVIPYRDTGFSALLSNAPAVLEKMDTLLANANVLLGEDNQRAVTQVLANIQRLTDSLAAHETRLEALPGAMEATLTDLRRVIGQVEGLIETAGPEATTALANAASVTERLDQLTGRLDGWLERHDEDMRAFASDGLGNMPALVDDTRDTLRELERLLESLRREPSRAIYRPASDGVVVEE